MDSNLSDVFAVVVSILLMFLIKEIVIFVKKNLIERSAMGESEQ